MPHVVNKNHMNEVTAFGMKAKFSRLYFWYGIFYWYF